VRKLPENINTNSKKKFWQKKLRGLMQEAEEWTLKLHGNMTSTKY
jgi:hypothetical protein